MQPPVLTKPEVHQIKGTDFELEYSLLDVQQRAQLNLVRVMVLSMHCGRTKHKVHKWGFVDFLDLFPSPSLGNRGSGIDCSGQTADCTASSCHTEVVYGMMDGFVEVQAARSPFGRITLMGKYLIVQVGPTFHNQLESAMVIAIHQ